MNDKPKLPARTKVQVTLGVIGKLLGKMPRIALITVAFFAIFWVGQQLYHRFAPAETFLNYYYAKVDDTPVGTEPLATLCRRVSTEGIKIEAFRTFIKFEDATGKSQVVGEYQFTAGVEQGDSNCQNVRLRKQPQIEGTYSVHTEYVFYVSGYRKSGSYDTNKYKMTPTQRSVDDRVKELEEQLEILKSQRSAETNSSTSTATSPGSSSSSSAGSNQQDTVGTTPPPTADQTPDTPIVPATPSETCIVNVLGLKLGCTTARLE